MSLANKALFVIERSLDEDLSLYEIAARCGVSRFHLAHAFGRSFGLSAIAYMRGRRLTEAARALQNGAPNILHLALDSGYASHEAFSRAFKAQFGITPEEARQSRPVAGWAEPLARLESKMSALKEPEIRREGKRLFVGVRSRMAYANIMSTASAQWRRFMAEAYSDIALKRPGPPVGLDFPVDDEGCEYVCAAGVTGFGFVPPGCEKVTVEPAEYAVFAHDGNVSQINETYRPIFDEWLPASGRTLADTPRLETYNDAFDPRTGDGGIKIWIPLKA